LVVEELGVQQAVGRHALLVREGLAPEAKLGQHRCGRRHPHAPGESDLVDELLHVLISALLLLAVIAVAIAVSAAAAASGTDGVPWPVGMGPDSLGGRSFGGAPLAIAPLPDVLTHHSGATLPICCVALAAAAAGGDGGRYPRHIAAWSTLCHHRRRRRRHHTSDEREREREMSNIRNSG
jgi:hypothetical protein